MGHWFDRQVFLDRDRQIEFVVLIPVDDAEAPVTDHRLDGELAQDRADRQGVTPLGIRARHQGIAGPQDR